jgi:hypothetical protein
LYEELKDRNFVVIAVAEDTDGATAAGTWIRAANPSYPCLIDERHIVAELYNMVNVPSAVWINEEGRLVRPVEPAGVGDEFRTMDHATYRMPHDAIAGMRLKRRVYLDALRDWVTRGEQSVHALSGEEVRSRTRGPTEKDTLAAANFRLGAYLYQNGHREDAQSYFAEAKLLRPESWNYARQRWSLEDPAKAAGLEFWSAVDALGGARYYPPIDMDGMPK